MTPYARVRSLNWLRYICILILVSLVLPLVGKPQVALAATATDLYISEYIEGSSSNKALEIYNGTGAPVDLTAGNYVIQMYSNGNTAPGVTLTLTGTVAANDVYVAANSPANATILAQADLTNGAGWYNGNDAIVLRKGGASGTILDVIGVVGTDPGAQWGTNPNDTLNNTLRRKSSLCAGETDPSNAFDPVTEWDSFATDDATGLGFHNPADCGDVAPFVLSTTPANLSTGFSVNGNILIKFNEPVTSTAASFSVSCTSSGSHTVAISQTSNVTTLNPDTDFSPVETCTVNVISSQIADQDAAVNTMAANYNFTFQTAAPAVCGGVATPIHEIQGTGSTSPKVGESHTIEGIVVGDFQGATSTELNGFFIQEEAADIDADPTTSEGIFVFEGSSAVVVAVGDRVRVAGVVSEFNDRTELSTVSYVLVCPVGTPMPAAYQLTLPVADTAIYEHIEGMLVETTQTLVTTETFWLGRYGQVGLTSDSPLWQPTQLAEPGAAANAIAAQNAKDILYLDDMTNTQNPESASYPGGAPYVVADPAGGFTLRVGDTVAPFTGVMDYSTGHPVYTIRPVGGLPTFTRAIARPTTPPSVGTTDVRIASFNVLNYFNGDENLDFSYPGYPSGHNRGANDATEFSRQRTKIIEAIAALDADVVGLMEIENDATPNSAIEDLVSGLNTKLGPGTYSFINTGVVGGDDIRVAIIYQPGEVTPVGSWATLETGPFANLSRPPIAQAFMDNTTGGVFVVVVNHFKSKGSACAGDADLGDGQGNCNQTRVQSATLLANWLETDPTGSGTDHVVIIGDLNAYAKEDPIDTLEAEGYINLGEYFDADLSSSYVFDGALGTLDHALVSPSLLNAVTDAEHWNINAEEASVIDYDMSFKGPLADDLYTATPYRSSDHDPVLIGLDFSAPSFTSLNTATFFTGRINTFTVAATGAPSPTYIVTAGSLPSGVTLNPTTGVLSGTPTTLGTFTFTITASNTVSPDATQVFTLKVFKRPTLAYNSVLQSGCNSGQPYFKYTMTNLVIGQTYTLHTVVTDGVNNYMTQMYPFTASRGSGALGLILYEMNQLGYPNPMPFPLPSNTPVQVIFTIGSSSGTPLYRVTFNYTCNTGTVTGVTSGYVP